MGKHISISYGKVKSEKAGAYNLENIMYHNNRVEGFESFYPNADPERRHLNRYDLIPLEEENYIEAYRSEISKARENGTMTKKIRKDAVLAIEVVTAFEKEEDKYTQEELDAWIEDNLAWMKKNFREENIKQAVLHMDESYPHIHFVIVPMSKDGTLNAHKFLDGPADLRTKRTNYYEEVGKKYGLERGVSEKTLRQEYNNARSGYMAKLKKATLGPIAKEVLNAEPREEELDEQGHIIPEIYIPRIKESIQNMGIENLAKMNKLSEEVNKHEAYLTKKYEEENRKSKAYNKQAKKLFDLIENRLESYEPALDVMYKTIITAETLTRALNNPDYGDSEKQEKLKRKINEIIRWQRQIDKEQKEKNLKKKKSIQEALGDKME